MTQEEREVKYPALTQMVEKMDQSFEMLRAVHNNQTYVQTLEQTVHSLTGKLEETRQEISNLKNTK